MVRGYHRGAEPWDDWNDGYTKRPIMRASMAIADSTYEQIIARSCLNCRDRGMCGEDWFSGVWPGESTLLGSCWEPEETKGSWRIRMEDEKRQASLAGGLEKVR